MTQKSSSKIVNFSEFQKRKDEFHLRVMAKRIVAAYHKHGEEGYHNAILSVTQGDSEFFDQLKPFIEEEAKKHKELL